MELSGFAGKGLMVGWLCCSCNPGPTLGLSLCLCAPCSTCSWQILLMSVRFQRGFRDCCRCDPIGRVVKKPKPYKNEITALEVHDKWKKSSKSLSTLQVDKFCFPLRESQRYMVGIQIRTTVCCLSRASQRSLSTQGKPFITVPKDL